MLKLNVGLTRKVGEANFGSRGASINLEQELDSALVADPAKLKERMRQLFAVVRSALAEELNGNGQPAHPKITAPLNKDGNGHESGTAAPSNGPRLATPSQVKAIHAIARSRHVNVFQFVKQRFNVARPDDLSIKEASQAIDELKATEVETG
jgi:hypothetical protein